MDQGVETMPMSSGAREQHLEDQKSESESDRKILEENQQVGPNANNIPIFSTSKSVMYPKKQMGQYFQEKADNKQNSISIQIMQGDCDCNLPTSPTQPKNFSENSSLRRNMQDQPQIINLFNVESVQPKEGDQKSCIEEQESAGNMEIPQECQSVSNSQQLRQQEITRALAFYQQGKDEENKKEEVVARGAGEKSEHDANDQVSNQNNNINIGPQLFLHQNNAMSNNSESNQNQSSSAIPRQAVYQMPTIFSVANNPLSQQEQLIPQRPNIQPHALQQNQVVPEAIIENNLRNVAQEIVLQPLGYFQLRHMLKILQALMISLAITGVINLFLTIISIVGLSNSLSSAGCSSAQNFIQGVLIPISIISFIVAFIDFFGLLVMYKREYQNLSKKQLSNMKLKVSDLQNCNNVVRAVRFKYPLLVVPQFFLKIAQFIVIIFSSIYYASDSDNMKSNCSSFVDNHVQQAYNIVQNVLLINLFEYLIIFVLYFIGAVIRSCINWKKKYDAQNLRNIRNSKFFKYKNESQLGKCESQCIICYQDYLIDEDLTILPCKAGHIFHKVCVGYWLEINQCCPTCKQSI